ncbi:MAG: Ribosomal protein 3/homing endonuclease-like fusion protein [Microgenomates bacterium 39_7]|nr:MAG: Ribosomal protein 3/homing endonuclease-like fusion protein [Microgenomates bacterium 39_7]
MSTKVLNPSYVAGFVDGEGCFTIVISKHKQKRLGLDARLHFEIELRADDEEILRRIQKTLQCGRIYHLDYSKYGWAPHVEYKVSSIKDLTQKVIPFFKNHPLQAKKKHSFECFCQAAEIFQRKEHLTLNGINKLRNIRKNMNQYDIKND